MLGVAPPLMADREFCLLPGQNSGASPPGRGAGLWSFSQPQSSPRSLRSPAIPSPTGGETAAWGHLTLWDSPRDLPEVVNAGNRPSTNGRQRVLSAAQAEGQNSGASPPGRRAGLWSFTQPQSSPRFPANPSPTGRAMAAGGHLALWDSLWDFPGAVYAGGGPSANGRQRVLSRQQTLELHPAPVLSEISSNP